MNPTVHPEKNQASPLAVVGLSALFPGSVNRQAFWRNIVDGRDFITEVPAGHWLAADYYDPDPRAPGKVYTSRGAFLPAVPFSPMEFGIPPANLSSTDTVQLLALLGARQLLGETRCWRESRVSRRNVSVMLGVAAGTELIGQMAAKIQRPHWAEAMRREGLDEAQVDAICQRIFDSYPDWNESTFPGLLANVTAGRIANRFDLGGTNCVIDAACASSLGAITLAADELRLGKTDLVVTGGADALNDIFMYMCFSRTPAMSFTGDCRPYANAADGTMMGEGIGLFALRRLADAERDGDVISAVITGIGSSSDGSARSVYAPRPEGQAEAIRRAWAEAGYLPREIELIEGHGTATKAGDAAEVAGLKQAFGPAPAGSGPWCALGSIKSQIGHTKSAAGAAGLFKAVMAVRHKVLPPSIKIEQPNPDLGLDDSPLYLNPQARPWIRDQAGRRKAGVSAFGFGGSNFHVVVEEYSGPLAAPRTARQPAPLVLAFAESAPALVAELDRLLDACGRASFAALARASQVAVTAGSPLRLAIQARDGNEFAALARAARAKLAEGTPADFSGPGGIYFSSAAPAPNALAFLFPGQGSQYVGMGGEIAMEFEAAREVWDWSAGRVASAGVHRRVFPPPAFAAAAQSAQEEALARTETTQPAIGLAALAHLAVLRRAGVAPDFAGGHSYGELVALHVAGTIGSREELLALSQARSRAMAEASAQTPGAMTAVFGAPADFAAHAADPALTIANHNSPRQSVVAGSAEAVAAFEARLDASSALRFQRLNVATGFHSPLVAAAAVPFAAALENAELRPPKIPVFANTTGQPYPDSAAEIRRLLAGQLAQPVLFRQQIEAMYAAGARCFLEVGPGSVLSGLVGQTLAGRPHLALAVDSRKRPGLEALFSALGRLAVAGVPVDFASLWQEFEPELDDPTASPLPKGAVMISGANLGKPYPPASGAGGRAPANAVAAQRDCFPSSSNGTIAAPHDLMELPPQAGSLDPPQRLALLEQIQRNVFEAHRNFQETMAQSQAAFLQASEALLRQIIAPPGTAPFETPAAPPPPAPQALAKGHAPEEPRPAPAALERAPAAPAFRDFQAIILATVAETTGYPADMIELDMELESGLGIDSIKKVEIFSALQGKIPEYAGADAAQLSKLGTLREILRFTVELTGGTGESQKKN